MNEVLIRLAATIESRRLADPEESYVSSLCSKGRDAILKKLGEEATETIIAAKSDDPKAVVHETADLWFHSLVLLSDCGLGPEAVLGELERRMGVSGLEEKRSRKRRD
ncbi:MAG: phosphoribosyl-ATP diphosphatase [Gammaproteobacteria bacterium]|nr:phosphoribosyl-ATP diphosphatase [Gammaproteobacteria bacterium]